jgi:lincosamide nucleotidyltransferase A/C/D/E
VQPDEVLTVIAALQEGNLRVRIDGGWGTDALLGEVTRPHDDLDLVVELGALGAVFECLSSLGYSVTEDVSPVRVVLRSAEGRQVDLHPNHLRRSRNGMAGWGGSGRLGLPVSCPWVHGREDHGRGGSMSDL